MKEKPFCTYWKQKGFDLSGGILLLYNYKIFILFAINILIILLAQSWG